jgi:probable F420-dependent oxidoreductase
MSIKIGVAPGAWRWSDGGPTYFSFVRACEALGWDSLWLSDRLVSTQLSLEPVVALVMAAARTETLKLGTSVIALPLRNPALFAKELATIEFLAPGRFFPAVGLGGEDEREYEAAGVAKRERAPRTDEAIGLLRRLLTEEDITHHGRFYQLTNVTIRPQLAAPPPIWIGGRTPLAWSRVARLGDGWLVSSVTPEEVAQGIAAIKAELPTHGRHIEDDHYGVLLGTYLSSSREEALTRAQGIAARLRPDVPVESYSALGTAADIRQRIQEYVASGASKFILRLACPEPEAHAQLQRLAEEVAVPFNTGEIRVA